MNLDFVHDVQQAYRNLLRAYAFPGTEQPLLPPGSELHTGGGTHTTAVLLAVTLLDNEVQSYMHDANEATATAIQQLTYTRFADAAAADSLFFFSAGVDELGTARTGTHIDPHLGADICIQVDTLPQQVDGADAVVTISGPGIQRPRGLTAADSDSWWWMETRNHLCREYPLGVETILFDTELNVMVFPRSTTIQSSGAQGGHVWHM